MGVLMRSGHKPMIIYPYWPRGKKRATPVSVKKYGIFGLCPHHFLECTVTWNTTMQWTMYKVGNNVT